MIHNCAFPLLFSIDLNCDTSPYFANNFISMKSLFCLLSFCIVEVSLTAQPTIQWQKSLGGTSSEEARCIYQTNDSGYIISGFTSSNNGNIFGNHGGIDFWVVKLDNEGSIQWSKTLGGTDNEWAYSIEQTHDGGYVLAGFTQSNDGDVSGNQGSKDAWVVKLTDIGTVQWQKTFGGSDWDEAGSIRQTSDSGYIIAGRSNSTNGDVLGNHGGFDFWIVKLNNMGTIQWTKSLGGSMNDIAYSVRQTQDGGYIAVGETQSNDGDVTGNHGSTDYWLVKLSTEGEIEWQKALGSNSLDRPNDVHQTSDGGYIVAGVASANNGDVTGHHGGYDYWVVKLSSFGIIEWQRALGGSGEDFAQAIFPTNDGGCIIAGPTQSNNGDVLNNDGGQDIWLIKLNNVGNIQWQKTLGGTQAESANSIQQTNDVGYVLAGYAWSNNGDVSGNHGAQDFWIVKLSPESSPTSEIQSQPVEIFPNPAQNSISLQIQAQESILNVQIHDLLGRKLCHQSIQTDAQIDISALPKGLYLLTATTPSGKVFSGKFCKQN